jgi:TetR/AcrR family transcriptional regulator, transcriptional repressor for nem operon
MARVREFDEQKILKIATDLFWHKGYTAVSTQDLIDAFGISKSSMYGAYKDKRSLFILALRNYRNTASKNMIDALKNNESFIDTITELLRQIINESITDNKAKGCFIVNTAIELAPHDKEILEIIQLNRKDIIEALTQAIQKGINTKELTSKNNPKALANYFYNIINGLRVDAKVTKDKLDYRDTIQLALAAMDVTEKPRRRPI